MFRLWIAAGAIALSGAAAQAASVTFDYTGLRGGAAPASQTVDGITATVSGLKCTSVDCGTSFGTSVQQWSNGLGIRTRRDSHQVDGRNGDDVVVFSFSEAVRVVSASFAYVDPNDDVMLFSFGAAGPVAGEKGRIALDNPFSGRSGGRGRDTGTYTFAGLFEGDTFGFGAVDRFDNWKLSSITVAAIAPVPLPAAGWMLLAGLGGLVALRRRA